MSAKTRGPLTDMAEGVAICGFTGPNGAGKTLLAVESALADLRRGREVYSTVPITSPWGDSKPVLSLRQLCELRGVTILLDDIAVILPSTTGGTLPAEVGIFLQTVRHHKDRLLWTAPGWLRAHNLVRLVTQGAVAVRPMLRYREKGNPWPHPRLVNAQLFDTATTKQDETPTRVLRRHLYVASRIVARDCYDTEADTPMLGHTGLGGRCVDCGGSIKVPPHSEERHLELGIPWYASDLQQDAIDSRRGVTFNAVETLPESDSEHVHTTGPDPILQPEPSLVAAQPFSWADPS